MSGAETEPGFVWSFTLGNIVTIITIVSAVIGGAFAFIRFIRKDVRDAILASTDKIDNLDVKITAQEQVTRDELKRNVERITEIKWMMQEVGKRVDETKHDANRRVDERITDIKEMTKKLEMLRDELYVLKLDVVGKIERSQTISSETRKNMQNILDSARIKGEETMDAIRRRMTEEDARGIRRQELNEEEDLAFEEKKEADALRHAKSTRIRHQAEDRKERGDERVEYKEEDRLTRVDELKDERDIRHTDEQRREQYEGDAGKVHRTRLEEKDDPESTQEEKREEEEEEEEEERGGGGGEKYKNE